MKEPIHPLTRIRNVIGMILKNGKINADNGKRNGA